MVHGRLGDSPSGRGGWEGTGGGETSRRLVLGGWNGKWQLESRVGSERLGDERRARTYNQLTFRQVKMVQDLTKRS